MSEIDRPLDAAVQQLARRILALAEVRGARITNVQLRARPPKTRSFLGFKVLQGSGSVELEVSFDYETTSLIVPGYLVRKPA